MRAENAHRGGVLGLATFRVPVFVIDGTVPEGRESSIEVRCAGSVERATTLIVAHLDPLAATGPTVPVLAMTVGSLTLVASGLVLSLLRPRGQSR